MNLNYKSSAAQRSSLKWGTERLYDTFCGHIGCVPCFYERSMGRGHIRVAAVDILHLRSDSVTAIFPGFI